MQTRDCVTVAEASALMGMSERAVRKKVAADMLTAQCVSETRGGTGGTSYRIPVEALPLEAQLRYWRERGGTDAGCGDADLIAYKSRYGEAGLRALLDARRLVLAARGMREAGADHLQERLAELATGHGITLRTLYRWEDRYAQHGLAGLMRKGRSDAGEPRTMCAEARRYILEQYLAPQRRTQDAVLRNLRRRAAELGAGGCENCPYREGSDNRDALEPDELAWYPPCTQAGGGIIVPANRSSVNRVIAQLSEAEIAYMRHGRKAWEAAYMYKNLRAKPDLVNQVWFGDHHQFDLFVLNSEGRPVRPWLTAWYDIGSGQLVGHVLSEQPNSQTILEAFKRAVAQKHGTPVCGLPACVYVDNGKDYRCERLEGERITEESLGHLNEKVRSGGIGAAGVGGASFYDLMLVQVVHAKAYHGWAKPVERWFRTLEERHVRELPGYCGGSPDARPENFGRMLRAQAERGELLTMDELYRVLRDEILPEYNRTPHEGYGGETPQERYARLPKARSDIPGWAMLALASEKSEKRKVTPQGVRFENGIYWDYALTRYVGEWVQILFNPGMSETITVCTLPGKGMASEFICEARPKETLKMVGEDAEKLARYVAVPRIQERELRQGIARMGVKLPGKRASGNVFFDAIDEEYAKGNVNSIDFMRVHEARRAARKRQEDSSAAENGQDEASEHFRRKGAELLRLKQNA